MREVHCAQNFRLLIYSCRSRGFASFLRLRAIRIYISKMVHGIVVFIKAIIQISALLSFYLFIVGRETRQNNLTNMLFIVMIVMNSYDLPLEWTRQAGGKHIDITDDHFIGHKILMCDPRCLFLSLSWFVAAGWGEIYVIWISPMIIDMLYI